MAEAPCDVCGGGIIRAGFIDPLKSDDDDGPVIPVPTDELLMDDCGMRSVDDVCERFDGPKLP